jgi:hypothetical protein
MSTRRSAFSVDVWCSSDLSEARVLRKGQQQQYSETGERHATEGFSATFRQTVADMSKTQTFNQVQSRYNTNVSQRWGARTNWAGLAYCSKVSSSRPIRTVPCPTFQTEQLIANSSPIRCKFKKAKKYWGALTNWAGLAYCSKVSSSSTVRTVDAMPRLSFTGSSARVMHQPPATMRATMKTRAWA